MDISTAHSNARNEAARVPALEASLALLTGATAATVTIYPAPRASPGDAPGVGAIVTIPLAPGIGTIDEALKRLVLTAPIEAQISATGVGHWARIEYDGAWWADASVSNLAGTGEIKFDDDETTAGDAQLVAGAFARLVSAVFQG